MMFDKVKVWGFLPLEKKVDLWNEFCEDVGKLYGVVHPNVGRIHEVFGIATAHIVMGERSGKYNYDHGWMSMDGYDSLFSSDDPMDLIGDVGELFEWIDDCIAGGESIETLDYHAVMKSRKTVKFVSEKLAKELETTLYDRAAVMIPGGYIMSSEELNELHGEIIVRTAELLLERMKEMGSTK